MVAGAAVTSHSLHIVWHKTVNPKCPQAVVVLVIVVALPVVEVRMGGGL